MRLIKTVDRIFSNYKIYPHQCAVLTSIGLFSQFSLKIFFVCVALQKLYKAMITPAVKVNDFNFIPKTFYFYLHSVRL